MFQCPVCGELLEALTNVHCVSRHHATRDKVIELHGAPKYVTPKMNREVQNWINQSQVIRRMDFEMAQGAVRNQGKRKA